MSILTQMRHSSRPDMVTLCSAWPGNKSGSVLTVCLSLLYVAGGSVE